MPIDMPPAKATGNDRKLATSAVASAAMTRLVIVVTCSCTIGAIRMAATPASADPRAQFTVASQSGDKPMEDAALSFSATAEVAIPKRV
jgi:hypothetical protein